PVYPLVPYTTLFRSFQDAVVDTLVIKCRRALEQTGVSRLVIAGGVGANQELRDQLQELGGRLGVSVFYPRPILCTDNGAMVAYAGFRRLQAGERASLDFSPTARWSLQDLREPG